MAAFAKSWRQFSWTIRCRHKRFLHAGGVSLPSQQYAMGLKDRRVRLPALRSAPRP
jgi:hypothetical protein